MFALIPTMNDWAERWLTVMWAVVWQLALVVAVATLIAWLLRRSSPVVRYWLWQIVAIKLLLMPFWTFAVPLPSWAENKPPERSASFQPPEGFENNAYQAGVSERRFRRRKPRTRRPRQRAAPFWEPLAAIGWQAWLLLLWCVVVLWQIVRLLGQRLRLARLLKRAVPAGGELARVGGASWPSKSGFAACRPSCRSMAIVRCSSAGCGGRGSCCRAG